MLLNASRCHTDLMKTAQFVLSFSTPTDLSTHRQSSGRMVGIHESHCQHKSTSILGALWRARVSSYQVIRLRTYASRLMVPASRRTGHPFAASSSAELSQKVEFGFSASPETIRKEPRELPPSLSPPTAGPAACASNNPVVVRSLLGKVFQATALPAMSSQGRKSSCLRSTASM